MKILSPTMNFIQSEIKIVKRTKRWKDEKEISKKGHFFAQISCLSHCFAENIVTNPRCIFQNRRSFMFLRGPSTKTSLTFLTSIMDWEILNNMGEHFLQKIHVKSSFCREDYGQSEIHHTKIKGFFVPKRSIYKNLSHIFHSDFIMRDTCTSLQVIFHTL